MKDLEWAFWEMKDSKQEKLYDHRGRKETIDCKIAKRRERIACVLTIDFFFLIL